MNASGCYSRPQELSEIISEYISTVVAFATKTPWRAFSLAYLFVVWLQKILQCVEVYLQIAHGCKLVLFVSLNVPKYVLNCLWNDASIFSCSEHCNCFPSSCMFFHFLSCRKQSTSHCNHLKQSGIVRSFLVDHGLSRILPEAPIELLHWTNPTSILTRTSFVSVSKTSRTDPFPPHLQWPGSAKTRTR